MARAFADAISRQDVEGLTGLMTPGHRFVDSLENVVEGRERMRAGWVGYFGMVPDFEVVVEEIFCDEPVAAIFGKARGTFTTDGTLKAENRWETPAAWRAVVEGGLVAEWRVYTDNEPMRELMRRAG